MFLERSVLSGRNAGNERNAREARSEWKLGRALASGLLAVLAVLASLAPSTAVAADKVYTDNGNGTVTDPVTQLTWMRCAMGQVWDGRTCTGTASSFNVTTSSALNGTTTFAGQTDWRVPSIRELLSIVDRTRLNPSIDTEAFPNTPFNGQFMSSTASATSASVRWTVSFEDSSPYNVYSSGFTRLVRGGQSTGLMDIFRPTADYVANADGTATHKPTNLTWQRCAVGRTWTGSACTGTASILTLAQATALNSNLAGKTDWRLPTVDELESLTNYTNQTNVLNSTIFRSSAGTDFFWSSSQYLRDIANNWFLRTDNGNLAYTLPTSPRQVLLVRSDTATSPVVVALTGIALSSNRLVIGSNGTLTISPIPSNATLPSCLAKSASGLTSSLVLISGSTVSLTAAANTVTAAETVTIQCGAFQTILTVTPNTNTIAIQMLVGPAALQSGGRTALTASAVSTFADGTTRTVSPVWSSSNSTAASVSASGVLSAGTVTADTPVTLTASFTDNDVTTSGTLQVTITAAPATLSVLQITGASTVQSGGQMRLIANARYTDGSSKAVFATSYALSNPALGSVNSRGVCSVVAVTVNTPLTVTATYVEGGVTKTASLPITITAAPAVLSRLTLIGASALLASGQTLNLSALGVYADTSSKPVVPIWQVTGTAATVSSNGVFKAMPVSVDTPVIVSASYSEAGVAVTAQFQVIIQATASVSPIQAEVQATGTKTNFGLAVWTSASSIAASAAPKGPGHASAKSTGNAKPSNTGRVFYKLFVAAVVPGGDGKLVPLDTVFTLNRNSDWQALGFPVAEYLNGVAEDSIQLIDIFDKLDVSIISGTKIFVGYGIDDQEMISSGRFRLVYQLQ